MASCTSISLFLLLLFPFTSSQTSETFNSSSTSSPTLSSPFHPSVALIVGIFSLMFSLTVLLLLYVKFCHSTTTFSTSPSTPFLSENRHFSGLNKSLIDSLPFFPFSSLRGLRHGLECAVCLSKFGDVEILRLLPKCKHAFHIECIDHWLQQHSSCPLCRSKVNAEDVNSFKLSTSSRFLFSSQLRDSNEMDLFVERHPSSRSFRRTAGNVIEDGEQVLPIVMDHGNWEQSFHKLKHKIVFSDVMFKGRWSDLNSRDLSSLHFAAEQQLSITENNYSTSFFVVDDTMLKMNEELEREKVVDTKAKEMNRALNLCTNSEDCRDCYSDKQLNTLGRRSVSEITNLSRFWKDSSSGNAMNERDKEEKVRRVWLPIARRTVQ